MLLLLSWYELVHNEACIQRHMKDLWRCNMHDTSRIFYKSVKDYDSGWCACRLFPRVSQMCPISLKSWEPFEQTALRTKWWPTKSCDKNNCPVVTYYFYRNGRNSWKYVSNRLEDLHNLNAVRILRTSIMDAKHCQK